MGKLLTVRQWAQRRGQHPKTIWRQIEEGRLKGAVHRLTTGRIRLDEDALLELEKKASIDHEGQ